MGSHRLLALAILAGVALAQGAIAAEGVAAPDVPEQELIRLTERFLQAVGAGDTAYITAHTFPEARFVYVEKGADGAVIRSTSTDLLLEAAPQWKSRVEERIRDPQVLLDGRMGLVWGRYDYRMDGRVDHCGIDAFTFMKTDDGWMLAAASWTVEHAGCSGGGAPKP